MPHELRVHEDSDGLRLALVIRKDTNQFLELLIPDGERVSFLTTWDDRANMNYWSEDSVHQTDGYFFAIRYLSYRNRFIVWRVEHVDGRPNDTFAVFHGSRSDMLEYFAR